VAIYLMLYVVIGAGFAVWAGYVAKAKREDVAFYAVLGLVLGLLGVVCAYLATPMTATPATPRELACRACGAVMR